ncbi:hypothetical protein Tco_1099399, partial [Tanacetum coccineum]
AVKKVAVCYEGCDRWCWLMRRLPQGLQASMKAIKELVDSFEGCHISCRLLWRLPHRLQAVTKVACHYEGCKRGCWLLLPQRLQAAIKTTTELAGSYRDCHIDCMLLQGLHAVVKAATEVAKAATKVVGYCEDYNVSCWLLRRLPHRLHAATKVVCGCEGCNRDINADWETRYAKEGNEINIIDGAMIYFNEKI